MVLALTLTLVLVLTLALAPSGMISKKGVPEFCPSTVIVVSSKYGLLMDFWARGLLFLGFLHCLKPTPGPKGYYYYYYY